MWMKDSWAWNKCVNNIILSREYATIVPFACFAAITIYYHTATAKIIDCE